MDVLLKTRSLDRHGGCHECHGIPSTQKRVGDIAVVFEIVAGVLSALLFFEPAALCLREPMASCLRDMGSLRSEDEVGRGCVARASATPTLTSTSLHLQMHREKIC